MDTLIVRDVRCFRGETRVHLAPLTLLVGENSTGKSTILALTRIAWELAYSLESPDFNAEPFQLGAYEELAHYHGGRGKRATSFGVGFLRRLQIQKPKRRQVVTEVLGTFQAIAGQPSLTRLEIGWEDWRISARQPGDALVLTLQTPSGEYELTGKPDLSPLGLSSRSLLYAAEVLVFGRRAEQEAFLWKTRPSPEESEVMLQIISGLLGYRRPRRPDRRPYAIAPIRTRPERTYDPLSETKSPEGGHVPMLLARLAATDKPRWEALQEQLISYGRAAGLFDEVKVVRYGAKESGPFQLRFHLPGQRKQVNLVDVGYGVSQVLPILVDSLTDAGHGFYLMQQPEVHLHPRAQAELGTFLVSLVSRGQHRFIIETHSDHLVDRVRMEIRDKKLPPGSVQLVFFERRDATVFAHKIAFDSRGNLKGAPPEYRDFFLREELRLISP